MNDVLPRLDHGLRRLGLLNSIVDRLVERLTPKMSATAASCGVPLYPTVCMATGVRSWPSSSCPGGVMYEWFVGFVIIYTNGQKTVAGPRQQTNSCTQPAPRPGPCFSTCS